MPDIVRSKVQPQCWSSHTSGHQQEAGLEQTQEQEGEEIEGGSFWRSEEIEGGHFGEVRRLRGVILAK